MSPPTWIDTAIARSHDRSSFDCGVPELNLHLHKYARQNHERGAARTYVALDAQDQTTILGYYTLCAACIEFAKVPSVLKRGLAQHDLPMVRLARLAVDLKHQGRGLGTALLLAAGRRAIQAAQHIGALALLIDAKDDHAARWYESQGALRLPDPELTLLLPLSHIESILPER